MFACIEDMFYQLTKVAIRGHRFDILNFRLTMIDQATHDVSHSMYCIRLWTHLQNMTICDLREVQGKAVLKKTFLKSRVLLAMTTFFYNSKTFVYYESLLQ